MAQQQILKVESSRQFRNPVSHLDQKGYHLTLNENQQRVVDTVCSDLDAGIHKTYLLRGGNPRRRKTKEVNMELDCAYGGTGTAGNCPDPGDCTHLSDRDAVL